VLRIVELSTGECLQKLFAADFPEESFAHSHMGEDFFIVVTEGILSLFEKQEDGTLTPLFQADCGGIYVSDESVICFDGERLALVEEAFTQGYRYRTCGFSLSVYGKKGLLYKGSFESSLSRGDDMDFYRYFCEYYGSDALEAVWES